MTYVFDDVEINTELVTLTKHKKTLEIEPKLFSLMVYLCQNPNRAISRDELINTVWENRFVSEAAINRAIGQLRKHIEDNTSHPKYIRTVSKVGYKLEAVVQHMPPAQLQREAIKQLSNNKKNISPKGVIFAASALVSIILLLFTVLQLDNPQLTTSVSIDNMRPITTSSNISFNPYFDSASNELLYLFKENSQSSAQIKVLNPQHQTLWVSQDNYYYTDVVLTLLHKY